RVIRGQDAKGMETVEAALQGGVEDKLPVGESQTPREPLQVLHPKVLENPVPHFPCRSLVLDLIARFAKEAGKAGGRLEPSPHSAGRKGKDAPPFFPKIVAFQRESCLSIPVARHKIPGGLDERAVERVDEIEIALALVKVPKGKDDQCGLVLLDWKLRTVLRKPGMPARTD